MLGEALFKNALISLPTHPRPRHSTILQGRYFYSSITEEDLKGDQVCHMSHVLLLVVESLFKSLIV